MDGAIARTWEIAGLTDQGQVRRSNQDSFGVDEAAGLFLVCDGMGGAAGGEIASGCAAEVFVTKASEALRSKVPARVALGMGVQEANRAVYAKASFNQRLRGMGCTLVAAHVEGLHAVVANVGDSRAYRLHGDKLSQVTRDHSYVAEAMRAGRMTEIEAKRSTMQSVITRAVGTDPTVEADFYELELSAGDALLLASDGLTRHLAEADLAQILSLVVSAEEQCARMIALANERGGIDNITCIVVRIRD